MLVDDYTLCSCIFHDLTQWRGFFFYLTLMKSPIELSMFSNQSVQQMHPVTLKKTPTATLHSHFVNPRPEIKCRIPPGGLVVDAVMNSVAAHDWTHTVILTDRACDLISVSPPHLLISAVFICSVPSWELAASAQQFHWGRSDERHGVRKHWCNNLKEKTCSCPGQDNDVCCPNKETQSWSLIAMPVKGCEVIVSVS